MDNKSGSFNKGGFDKFYTKIEVASDCVDIFSNYASKDILVIEPSAGNGRLMTALRNNGFKVKGFDIAPEDDDIVQDDFLSLDKTNWSGNVFMNPPFGRNAVLAIKFFNECAKFADIIGIIAPRTFNKFTLQNKLSLKFELKQSTILPIDSFTLDDNSYSIYCCFQVWIKVDSPRVIKKYDFDKYAKVVPKGQHNIAVRRVGSKAGQVVLTGSEENVFYLQTNDIVANALHAIDYNRFVRESVALPSINKQELAYLLDEFFNKN